MTTVDAIISPDPYPYHYSQDNNIFGILKLSTPTMSVLALAIINNKNTPVLVRTRDEESLDLLFKLHSSLDVIEEKQNTRDQYLGILCQSDTYKIYGLCSLTHTKVLLMVSNNVIKDNEARSILRTLHNTYVDVTSNNPFYVYGQPVKSKFLLDKINEIFM